MRPNENEKIVLEREMDEIRRVEGRDCSKSRCYVAKVVSSMWRRMVASSICRDVRAMVRPAMANRRCEARCSLWEGAGMKTKGFSIGSILYSLFSARRQRLSCSAATVTRTPPPIDGNPSEDW